MEQYNIRDSFLELFESALDFRLGTSDMVNDIALEPQEI